MRSLRTNRVLLVAVAAALCLGMTVPSSGADVSSELSSSGNVDFVTNLGFELLYEESSRRATDMDFATMTVSERPGKGIGRGGPAHQVERDFAFVGTYLNGLQVVDITDPATPEVVAVYDCAIAQSDVWLFERPDLGRTFVAYSSDEIASQHDFDSRCHTDNGVEEGTYGTFIVDVTEPYDPQSVSFIPFPRGTHQVSVHPSNEWVYSSPAALVTDTTGEFHIADISDPWNPGEAETVPLTTGLDAHDIIFDGSGDRAYAASLTHTLVLDTSDPGDPEVIGRIVDPAINIHHEAHPYTTVDETTGIEQTFLLIVDEFAGAAGNEVCPGGGVHVYDITGHLERAPVKVGAFFAPEVGLGEGAGHGTLGTDRCTAHVMQIHGDHDAAIIAWYALGTRVLDLSGLVGLSAGLSEETGSQGIGIREIGYAHFDDSDVWAVKADRIDDDGTFHAYVADTNRMLDVLHIDLRGGASVEQQGRWLTPDEAAEEAAARALLGGGTITTSCLLD